MKRNILLVFILIFSFILAGCAKISIDADTSATPNSTASETGGDGSGQSKSGDGKDENADTSGHATITKANNEFSWEILNLINKEDSEKEIFISPLSISTMLTMALNGAEGTTKKEMEKALHYEGMTPDEINNGYASLLERIKNLDEKVTIEIANSIWARDSFHIKPDYIEKNRNYLSADVRSLNFDLHDAASTINKWIADKTGNLITKMIDPPINPDVMMYLINAIYFKGEWTESFKEKDTITEDFHAIDGKTDKVSMMKRRGNIQYAKQGSYSAVMLPYGNESTNMVVILPEGDINRFISSMDNEKWISLLNELRHADNLHLQLPKFKMEYGIKELKSVLTGMGMGEAFSDRANFTGIAEENLCISSVLHKAVVDVNEEGTEAAAATVGTIVFTSYTEPVSFIANRPFLFVITDNEDGIILFIGKKIYGDR